MARKLERRVAVSLEYGTKALYAGLVGYAVATRDRADTEIHTVVVGLDPTDPAREPELRVVRDLGGGRTLIRTPRDQAHTDLLVRLARRGRDVAELFELSIQSRPDRRRVGLDVSVEHLAAAIRTVEPASITIEHIY